MHITAKDNRGNKVPIEAAQDGKPYTCLWCDAKMHSRRPLERMAHFACYPGQFHKTSFCINRANSNIVRTLDDPDEFFRHLFTDDRPIQGGRGGTQPGPEPPGREFPPDDIDGNVDIIDSDNVITRPFRSLRQLWTYGLNSLNWDDSESHSDLVIFEAWYKHLFYNFTGGNRVIQTKPAYIDFERKQIKFQCYWKVKSRKNGNGANDEYQPRRRTLIVQFENKDLFNAIKTRLGWHKVEKPNGCLGAKIECQSALIAGFWTQSNDDEYTYHARCTCEKQIYAINE